MNLRPRIQCADGFSISVQAYSGAYCTPRNDIGPYTEVELGYPSAVPPDYILEYAEEVNKPTDTVYAYVPINLVWQMLQEHGGPVDPKSKAAIPELSGILR